VRKQTGLRNRFRNGRGTYSRRAKGKIADSYGSYVNGRATRGENIAGKSIATTIRKALEGLF